MDLLVSDEPVEADVVFDAIIGCSFLLGAVRGPTAGLAGAAAWAEATQRLPGPPEV